MIVYGRVVLGRDSKESVLDFCSTLLSMVGHSCKTLRRTALLITLSFSHLRTGDIPTDQEVGSSNLSGRAISKNLRRLIQVLPLFLLDFARLSAEKSPDFLVTAWRIST
jgi:hypothetical protein